MNKNLKFLIAVKDFARKKLKYCSPYISPRQVISRSQHRSEFNSEGLQAHGGYAQ